MKNINAQNVEPGMVAMAAGYTINTNPGPSVATSCIGLCDTWAMYPSTANITNPAMKLVHELITLVSNASLEVQKKFIFVSCVYD